MDRGAKFLVVQGLPPIGCLPLQLATCPSNDRDQNGCSASANLVIKGHNNLLQKRLDEIRMQHKDSMILYIDYYNAFIAILEKHTQYQFEEPSRHVVELGEDHSTINQTSFVELLAPLLVRTPAPTLTLMVFT